MALPPDAKHDAEQRMLGAVSGVPAVGRGPAPEGDYSRHEYHHESQDQVEEELERGDLVLVAVLVLVLGFGHAPA